MATTNAIAKPHAQWQGLDATAEKSQKFRHRTRRGPALPARSRQREVRLPRPSTAPARRARPTGRAPTRRRSSRTSARSRRGASRRRRARRPRARGGVRRRAVGLPPADHGPLTHCLPVSPLARLVARVALAGAAVVPRNERCDRGSRRRPPPPPPPPPRSGSDAPAPGSLAGASHVHGALVTGRPAPTRRRSLIGVQPRAPDVGVPEQDSNHLRARRRVTLGTSPARVRRRRRRRRVLTH